MKPALDRYPTAGEIQRVLLTPRFVELCQYGRPEALTPILEVYGIEVLGMPHTPASGMEAWCMINGIELIVWPNAAWMDGAVEMLWPTMVLAGDGLDDLGIRGRDHGRPVLTLSA